MRQLLDNWASFKTILKRKEKKPRIVSTGQDALQAGRMVKKEDGKIRLVMPANQMGELGGGNYGYLIQNTRY